MITLNKAKRLALDGVVRAYGESGDPARFDDEETQCSRRGWVFRYGARTVIVTHQGVAHVFRDGRSIEEAVAEFEQYRAECTTQNRGV